MYDQEGLFMDRRISELTALLAFLGITSTGAATAADTEKSSQKKGPMFIAEKKTGTKKGGASACGKGSCGTDKKGAAAAKQKHAAPGESKTATDTKSESDKKPAK
jgi:uncharacterized low-complexity protein